MNMMNRRFALSSIVAGAISLLAGGRASAQNNQAVSGEIQVVSTGDVIVDQATGASQTITSTITAGPAVGNGQVVQSSGQIVSTGDVVFTQSTAGDQEIGGIITPHPQQICEPGQVWADPGTGELYYCSNQCWDGGGCCWVPFQWDCQKRCQPRRCDSC